MNKAAAQLGAFSKAGGQVLFGTDVGYTDLFDTSDEFKWMSRAGMSFDEILSSLTTNPAERFKFCHSHRTHRPGNGPRVWSSWPQTPPRTRPLFPKSATRSSAGKVIYSAK